MSYYRDGGGGGGGGGGDGIDSSILRAPGGRCSSSNAATADGEGELEPSMKRVGAVPAMAIESCVPCQQKSAFGGLGLILRAILWWESPLRCETRQAAVAKMTLPTSG